MTKQSFILEDAARKVKQLIDLLAQGKTLDFHHNDCEWRPYKGMNLSELIMSPHRYRERELSPEERLEREKERVSCEAGVMLCELQGAFNHLNGALCNALDDKFSALISSISITDKG